MERAIQPRAVVGQRREQQKNANVGACVGCSQPPGNCGCVPLSGPAPMIVPPIGIDAIPRKLLGNSGELGPAADWYTANVRGNPYPCVPYADAVRDRLLMTPVTSGAPVTVAIGATSAAINIAPTRGWFDAFYFDISVLDPATGLAVDPASYRITPPRVADCPQPFDTAAQRGTFWRAEDCCAGIPFRAFIGRTTDGEQLSFTLTNDGIGSVSVQAMVRGWGHARSLCLT
jgi:hypothetical protein